MTRLLARRKLSQGDKSRRTKLEAERLYVAARPIIRNKQAANKV